MALDLFFVPEGLNLKRARARKRMDAAAAVARQALVSALEQDFPGTRFIGTAGPSKGHVENFPLGEISVEPGYWHWSLHGEADESQIRSIVDWFRANQMRCADPQDAGFGNLQPDKAATLASWDELNGAGLTRLRHTLSGSTLELYFQLADGRYLCSEYGGAVTLALPADMRALRDGKVLKVEQMPAQIFDQYSLHFDNGLLLSFEAAMVKHTISANPPEA